MKVFLNVINTNKAKLKLEWQAILCSQPQVTQDESLSFLSCDPILLAVAGQEGIEIPVELPLWVYKALLNKHKYYLQ